ncbi:MAG: SIR2 family protein [Chthoniobacter sp.]|uniref:SIR2 family protein n=1 Tax=Chthoniobacter sp. TaxID=2510640 RepID=UPI0032A3325B
MSEKHEGGMSSPRTEDEWKGRVITESEALDLIWPIHDGDRSREPWVSLVGAGISAPQIPCIGPELYRLMAQSSATVPPTSAQFEASFGGYKEALQKWLPFPANQAAFFENLSTRTCISRANTLLALLLSDGRIGNTVVTTNFDDHLERAMRIFGKRRMRVARGLNEFGRVQNNSSGDPIKLFHAHGTFEFDDLINHEASMEEQLNSPGFEQLVNMFVGAERIVVVGYGCGVDDIVSIALQEARKRNWRARSGAFWYCYSASDLQKLRSHPIYSRWRTLRAVVPDAIHQWFRNGENQDHLEKIPKVLPADQIFDSFLKRVAPQGRIARAVSFHEAPLTFFKEQIEDAIGRDADGNPMVKGAPSELVQAYEAMTRAVDTFHRLMKEGEEARQIILRAKELLDQRDSSIAGVLVAFSLSPACPVFVHVVEEYCGLVIAAATSPKLGLLGYQRVQVYHSGGVWATAAIRHPTFSVLPNADRHQQKIIDSFLACQLALRENLRRGGAFPVARQHQPLETFQDPVEIILNPRNWVPSDAKENHLYLPHWPNEELTKALQLRLNAPVDSINSTNSPAAFANEFRQAVTKLDSSTWPEEEIARMIVWADQWALVDLRLESDS